MRKGSKTKARSPTLRLQRQGSSPQISTAFAQFSGTEFVPVPPKNHDGRKSEINLKTVEDEAEIPNFGPDAPPVPDVETKKGAVALRSLLPTRRRRASTSHSHLSMESSASTRSHASTPFYSNAEDGDVDEEYIPVKQLEKLRPKKEFVTYSDMYTDDRFSWECLEQGNVLDLLESGHSNNRMNPAIQYLDEISQQRANLASKRLKGATNERLPTTHSKVDIAKYKSMNSRLTNTEKAILLEEMRQEQSIQGVSTKGILKNGKSKNVNLRQNDAKPRVAKYKKQYKKRKDRWFSCFSIILLSIVLFVVAIAGGLVLYTILSQ